MVIIGGEIGEEREIAVMRIGVEMEIAVTMHRPALLTAAIGEEIVAMMLRPVRLPRIERQMRIGEEIAVMHRHGHLLRTGKHQTDNHQTFLVEGIVEEVEVAPWVEAAAVDLEAEVVAGEEGVEA